MVTIQPIVQIRCTKALGRAWGGREEGPWLRSLGLVQRVQRGKGIKHGSRLGPGPMMSLCSARPPTGSGLGHCGTDKVVQVLFVWGGLSQEGGVRVGGICSPLP